MRRMRILRRRVSELQNTQITSHRACGLGKQKSKAFFDFWTTTDIPRSRFRNLRSRKRDKQIQIPAKSAETSVKQETWRSVEISAADGGQAEN